MYLAIWLYVGERASAYNRILSLITNIFSYFSKLTDHQIRKIQNKKVLLLIGIIA